MIINWIGSGHGQAPAENENTTQNVQPQQQQSYCNYETQSFIDVIILLFLFEEYGLNFSVWKKTMIFHIAKCIQMHWKNAKRNMACKNEND